MTQAKVITISEAAATLYIQAEISELAAIVAYAFDTLTFEKAEYHHYNILAVDTLKLSLSTMRNRATAARGLQVKYGAKIAGYVDGLTQETGNDFGTFLKSEMSLAGNFHMHSEDIGNFLAGKKPAHVQRQEAKDAAAEVKRIKDETAKKKADKEAADKAARDADTSGTVDAEAAVVPEKGTEVGHAENAPSVPVADMPKAPIAESVPTVAEVQEELKAEKELSALALQKLEKMEFLEMATLLRVSETEEGIEIDVENCPTGVLQAVIKTLQDVVKSRKAELANLVKKAA